MAIGSPNPFIKGYCSENPCSDDNKLKDTCCPSLCNYTTKIIAIVFPPCPWEQVSPILKGTFSKMVKVYGKKNYGKILHTNVLQMYIPVSSMSWQGLEISGDDLILDLHIQGKDIGAFISYLEPRLEITMVVYAEEDEDRRQIGCIHLNIGVKKDE